MRGFALELSRYHDKSRQTGQAALELRTREICETQVRCGYRRVYVVPDREGWEASIKMVYYVYRALGLQLGKKTPKRRVKPSCVTTMRKPLGRTMSAPWTDPDQKIVRGSVFPANVHDQRALGKKLRILSIVDTHSRYCPATDMRFQHRGENVVQTLERICGKIGYRSFAKP